MTDTVQTRTRTLMIDTAHSVAEFAVRHMMISTVKGRFTDVQGSIELPDDDFSGATVSVSISVDSISTGDEKRDAHLRSADFFELEQYPTITFESTGVENISGDEFDLKGILTMHGVAQPVVIKAESTGNVLSPWGKNVYGFTGTTRVNRKDFGLTWNVGLETGGVMVADEIKITLEIEAIESE